MLIMAEVSSEMGAELRAAAMANKTSVAGEVGRRLERLARLEAKDSGDQSMVIRNPAPDAAPGLSTGKTRTFTISCERLYSGLPNPWDMFRNTGGGR